MKIVIIGKYPPVQGGVSARTYRYAHGLAERGHEVHVVTNADEAVPPFRMFMRPEDWDRCAASHDPGSVTVHWTEPADQRQFHIPMAAPFVSKLASLATSVGRDVGADAVFSYYAEPYAVAGHLAAEILGVPHIVRTAGSDAGRLWDHPQFQPLYDHVFTSADAVLAGGPVAEKMIDAGVDPSRLFLDRDFYIQDDLFTQDGPVLDLAALTEQVDGTHEFAPLLWGEAPPDMTFVGVYGKLGPKKGTLALLRALARLDRQGREIGLLLMAHARPRAPHDYRAEIEALGLTGRVLQIPFLPNWRVPEFIRRCLAVCCLEQDFPIPFHTPIVAREVLACGGCLVGSTEILNKLPDAKRMVDGYNCVAVPDVEDSDALADALGAIVDDPAPAAEVGARGREYVRHIQEGLDFPASLERVLELVMARRSGGAPRPVLPAGDGPASLTRLALDSLSPAQRAALADAAASDPSLEAVATAIRFDALVSDNGASGDGEPRDDAPDPLFRLSRHGWALAEDGIADLLPSLFTPVHIEQFDFDVTAFVDAAQTGEFSDAPPRRTTFVVTRDGAFTMNDGPFIMDALEGHVLELCDGTRTADAIARSIRDLEPFADCDNDAVGSVILHLFEIGLLRLDEAPP